MRCCTVAAWLASGSPISVCARAPITVMKRRSVANRRDILCIAVVDIIKGNALSERRNFAPNLLGLGRIEPRMKSESLQ
jgi:hypothetical protein